MAAASRTAAFFDFDGTIIAGYSILAFLAERVRAREQGAASLSRTALAVAQAALGRIDSRELIARGLHEWSGQPLAGLEALGERLFASDLRNRIYPEIRALLTEHRRRGHVVVIATSAAPFQVGPVARELGVEHVLCTRLEVRDGIVTGKTRGPILWGRAKAEAVREFARAQGIDLRRSYFYADGDEDVALMRDVGHPRPTNPRPRLEEAARAQGWTVRRYRSRVAPGPEGYLRSAYAALGDLPVFAGAVAMRALPGDRHPAGNLVVAALGEVLFRLGRLRLNVHGEENLWAARPAVFIWNHRNFLDVQVVGRLVRRDFGAAQATEPAVKLLGDGLSVLVAPEGKRQEGEAVGAFRKDAFRIAMAAGVPIVPIVVRNAVGTIGRASGTMRNGTVDVAVLPPVSVEGWTQRDLGRRIAEVRQAFVDTLGKWPDGPGKRQARRKRR